MTRVRLAGVAVAITLGVLIAGRASALAALVQIPLHINYLELNAALRQQLYTGADGRIEVWNMASTPQLASIYDGHIQIGNGEGSITALRWSPKAYLVASACTNGSVHVWPVR